MWRGFYLRWGDSLDESSNREIQALARAILETPHPALTDVIPGYTTLYIEYEATLSDEATLRRWIDSLEADAVSPEREPLRIPVTYEGPDLEIVAAHTGLSRAEVIRRHSARPYRVFATGFTPGLAFMGTLEPDLHTPRCPSARPRVEAGTVAIANAQTTVYPVASPGGWNLLGRAHSQIYDPLRSEPLLFTAGDLVQFIATDAKPPPQRESRLELLPVEPHYPLLRVVEPGLLDLIVDSGRLFGGRFGFARSGPLDAGAASRANRLVGNPAGTPLLELNLNGSTFEACGRGVLALCGGLRSVLNGERLSPETRFAVRSGDRLAFVPLEHGCRAYLAVAGGFEMQAFRGSASTDLRGRIGRALQDGDVLGVATPRAVRAGRSLYRSFHTDLPLRLLPGPQASREAFEAFIRQTFRVGRADRMGLHLLGGEVPGGEIVSEAVPLGAVQVPPGGTPTLLFNDRGTLGGYAKPALLHPADLPRAAQLRPGEYVRFTRYVGR